MRWDRGIYSICKINSFWSWLSNDLLIIILFLQFLNLYPWPRSNLSRPRVQCKPDKVRSENLTYFQPEEIRSENLKYLLNLLYCPWYWGSMRQGPLGNPGHPSHLICSHLTNTKQFAPSELLFLPFKLTTCTQSASGESIWMNNTLFNVLFSCRQVLLSIDTLFMIPNISIWPRPLHLINGNGFGKNVGKFFRCWFIWSMAI